MANDPRLKLILCATWREDHLLRPSMTPHRLYSPGGRTLGSRDAPLARQWGRHLGLEPIWLRPSSRLINVISEVDGSKFGLYRAVIDGILASRSLATANLDSLSISDSASSLLDR